VSLDGKVACITGAAGGVGVSIVEVFERQGALVVPVDVQGAGMVSLDIGTDAGNKAMVELAIERHGRLDVLVLNAGAQYLAPIPEHSVAEWDRLFDVMVKGPWLAMKHAWPHLARPGGRIVVTASGSSFIAEKYKAAYVAAKHAVLGLVRVAALEGGPTGMTVNAVGPGWVRTAMVENQLVEQTRLHRRSRNEIIESMVDRHPVKRFVEPEEVANAIAFLASDAASGINGSFIPVDLGTLAC
jgi:3-hydroxybutyrate dehydrogenase